MTPSESRALAELAVLPMTTHELAYRIGVTRDYATRITQRLGENGLVRVVRTLRHVGPPERVWSAAV